MGKTFQGEKAKISKIQAVIAVQGIEEEIV
jgi:hypothetical protein